MDIEITQIETKEAELEAQNVELMQKQHAMYSLSDKQQDWIDIRLQPEEMNFLKDKISEENNMDMRSTLAGNVSKSNKLIDKDNWFYETALKKLTEKMFYRNWNDYCKYHIEKERPLPKFELGELWVNYQKQHEFNPPHNHGGLYSFVIFIKIPTHWKEQHALPFVINSNTPCASDFQFLLPIPLQRQTASSNTLYPIPFKPYLIPLSPEDEGRMLFFPATLHHQVFPFYGTEEERITISGNIFRTLPPTQDDGGPKRAESRDPSSLDCFLKDPIEVEGLSNKEKILQIMEEGVQNLREETDGVRGGHPKKVRIHD